MEKADAGGKGKIVLATVKGDVHDIGKNLVDIILSNNGYETVNLGIKIGINEMIEAAQAEGELGDFDVRRFLFHLASSIVTFHASPTMRRYILGSDYSAQEERDAFLRSIREKISNDTLE